MSHTIGCQRFNPLLIRPVHEKVAAEQRQERLHGTPGNASRLGYQWQVKRYFHRQELATERLLHSRPGIDGPPATLRRLLREVVEQITRKDAQLRCKDWHSISSKDRRATG